jgi:hypothetical protein
VLDGLLGELDRLLGPLEVQTVNCLILRALKKKDQINGRLNNRPVNVVEDES